MQCANRRARYVAFTPDSLSRGPAADTTSYALPTLYMRVAECLIRDRATCETLD